MSRSSVPELRCAVVGGAVIEGEEGHRAVIEGEEGHRAVIEG